MDDRRTSLLIVGGGIAGLATALATAKNGTEVTVLEASPEFGEVGAGIQLGPNATLALKQLGVFDAIAELSVFPESLVYMDALSGDQITSVDLGQPFLDRYKHPYIVLHRGDLHRVLLEACNGQPSILLETDSRVEAIDDLGDRVVCRTDRGTEYTADAVVGADGLRSVARSRISDDEPIANGYVAYRGTLPVSDITPHAGMESVVMWVGPGLHLVQYKIRGGELYNQVGVFRSEMYGKSDDWGTPDELDEHFGQCCDPVRVGASKLGRALRWPMADREPLTNWSDNRVTLLGDAAHAMLQYLAQGGCQALEDSLCLARALSQDQDWVEAFGSYQNERIPRTTDVVRNARWFGEFCHLSGVARDVRNAFLGERSPQDYERLDWLYAHDPQSN